MADSTSGQRASRRGLALLGAALTGLAALAAVAVIAARPGSEAAGGRAGEGPYRGSEPPGRNPLPAFELRSYRGGQVVSRDLRGRVVLLTLLDSHCTEVCPVLASAVARALDELNAAERAQVRAIAVTADPTADTPASVRDFLRAQRAEGRLDYLLGREPELRPLWNALQVLSSLDTGRHTLHSAPLRLYDGRGVWVSTLHAGVDLNQANLLHDIRFALASRSDDTR